MIDRPRLRARLLLAGPLFALAAPVAPALAQDDGPSLIVLGEVTCKDVMAQDGEDRDRSISFLHGYVAGEAGRTELDLAALADASATFIDRCLDSPAAVAVDTMRGAAN